MTDRCSDLAPFLAARPRGLLGEEDVGDHRALRFELTPKSDDLRATVSRVQLTIDQGSWLPLEQQVFHSDAVQSVTARYVHHARNLPLDDALFKPKWPKGTETIKR